MPFLLDTQEVTDSSSVGPTTFIFVLPSKLDAPCTEYYPLAQNVLPPLV